jgi:hypothetical protein
VKPPGLGHGELRQQKDVQEEIFWPDLTWTKKERSIMPCNGHVFEDFVWWGQEMKATYFFWD